MSTLIDALKEAKGDPSKVKIHGIPVKADISQMPRKYQVYFAEETYVILRDSTVIVDLFKVKTVNGRNYRDASISDGTAVDIGHGTDYLEEFDLVGAFQDTHHFRGRDFHTLVEKARNSEKNMTHA